MPDTELAEACGALTTPPRPVPDSRRPAAEVATPLAGTGATVTRPGTEPAPAEPADTHALDR